MKRRKFLTSTSLIASPLLAVNARAQSDTGLRVSMDEKDIGYHRTCVNLKPYLNGEFINNCLTADEGQGTVTVYEGRSTVIKHGTVELRGWSDAERAAHIDRVKHRITPAST